MSNDISFIYFNSKYENKDEQFLQMIANKNPNYN